MKCILAIAAGLLLASFAMGSPAPPGTPGVLTVDLRTNDIVYNASDGNLYAATPGDAGVYANSICRINPHTGLVTASAYIGLEPSELALADDGRTLYVGLPIDDVVREFDLPTMTPGAAFSLGTGAFSEPYFLTQMLPYPGSPRTLAISRRFFLFGSRQAGVGIYDNGGPRPLSTDDYPGANWITLDPESGTVYGYHGSAAGFQRIEVDALGAVLADSTENLVPGYDQQIEYAGGLIYAGSGFVVDPATLERVGRFPLGETGPLVADAALRKVFFMQDDEILVFGMDTYQLLGIIPLPVTYGWTDDLLRWGTDGLAYRSVTGPLYILRNALVGSPLYADLSVTQEDDADPVVNGDSIDYTITVTNEGPGAATHVFLTDYLSDKVDYQSASKSCRPSSTKVFCALKSLAPGETKTIRITVRAQGDGVADNLVEVRADQDDSRATNNTSLEWTSLSRGPEEVSLVSLLANDITWDPLRHRLYVAVSGGDAVHGHRLVSLDPRTRRVVRSLDVGLEPSVLALSDDSQFLYVALRHVPRVARINLTTWTVDLVFAPGTDPDHGPLYAEDLAVVPGSPRSVAVSRMSDAFLSPRHQGVAVYDDGVVRPVTTAMWDVANSIAFDAATGLLYGYENELSGYHLREMELDPGGVVLTSATSNLIDGFWVKIVAAGGRIYSTSGDVVDLPPSRAGRFAVGPSCSGVAPDPAAHRVYLLDDNVLRAFDDGSLQEVGSVKAESIAGKPGKLIRYGSSSLAFLTTGGQLHLVGTPLVPTRDSDGDGFPDGDDNCIAEANAGQADLDQDGIGDPCDGDNDNDTVPDTADSCPLKFDPGQADVDHDAVGDACDVCAFVADPVQMDGDADGAGDSCDNCTGVPNPAQSDSDGDLFGDECDSCPRAADPAQADADVDGIGDVCELVLVEPPAAAALPRTGLPPLFTWSAGTFDLYRAEFASTPAFTGKIVACTKKAATAVSCEPTPGRWKKILSLASPGAPVYWRIMGTPSDGGKPIPSDEVRSLRLMP